MKLLAIETSTKNLSLAVSAGGKIIKQKDIVLEKMLSDKIMLCIDRILKRAKIGLEELDALSVGLGPGSFTSLRVGLATVKGLVFLSGKPILGIPSLDVIAMNAKNEGKQVCVIVDARRNLVFSCLYKKTRGKLKRIGKYSLGDIKDVLARIKAPTIFTGDAVEIYSEELKDNKNIIIFKNGKDWYPNAVYMAQLAEERFRNKKFDDVNKIVPLYLYPKDCQVKIRVK